MNCSNCNSMIPDNSDFCPNCGLQLVAKPTTHISPSVCPNCGSREYFKNGKCVSCGRKNSRAVKNKKFIIAFVAFALVMIFTVGFWFMVAIALSETGDEYKSEAERYDKKYKTVSEEYEELSESYKDLENLGGEFFDKHAVIVPDNGSNLYHKYGCSGIGSSDFWIYNSEAASAKGYKPCSRCCD